MTRVNAAFLLSCFANSYLPTQTQHPTLNTKASNITQTCSSLRSLDKQQSMFIPGGMTFAYNADLYYRDYFPDVDLGWWLFAVTVGIGSIGVVVGGVISDK